MNKIFMLAVIITYYFPFNSNANEGTFTDQREYLRSYSEPKRIKYNLESYESDLFGENINLFNGTVIFERRDAVIPGNSDLDISYRVSYNTYMPNSTDWEEEVPRVEAYFAYSVNSKKSSQPKDWMDGKYCTGNLLRSKNDKLVLEDARRAFHSPPKIVIPGVGSEVLLSNNEKLGKNSTDYRYVTKKGWIVNCYDSNGSEGFKVKLPNGHIYYFENGKKIVPTKILDVEGASISFPPDSPYYRIYDAIYISKVEDKYGNYLNYKYTSRGLDSIESNDGRVIRVQYDKNVKTITATDTKGTYEHKWIYDKNLVTRPDGKKWKYDLYQVDAWPSDLILAGGASNPPCILINQFSGSMFITHPDGAIGRFDFKEKFQNKANDYGWGSVPGCHKTYSIVEKGIKFDSNSKELIWKYDYNSGTSSYLNKFTKNTAPEIYKIPNPVPNNVDRYLSKTATVTYPNLDKTITYFNRDHSSYLEGKMIAEEFYNSNSTVLRVNEYYYRPSNVYGTLPVDYVEGNFASWNIEPLMEKKITHISNDVYVIENKDFDIFNNPTITTETGANNFSIDYKLNYYHDYSNWILSQLETKSILGTDSAPELEVSYYTNGVNSSKPYEIKKHGKVIATYKEYHQDGNLKRVNYNEDGSRFAQFENYYRGKPRKITLPCPLVNGCNTINGSTSNSMISLVEIDSDGSTKSVTDFNGNKTSYTYNPIGWLTKIDYADPKWLDKVISYAVVNIPGDGISGSDVAVGSLRQTISQGNYQKRIYHDGLLRPILTQELDISNPSTTRYQSFAYDHDNRQTLASFPSADASNRIGMETEYDALGRVITQTRTSDGSVSRREYLSGNKVAVTNGENNTTTTTYLAYGEPSFDKPTLIEAPDTDDVTIDYNVFDQVTSIRQGNVTEKRIYDAYQQLCKQVRPETGISAFGYNGQRQLIWRADGTNGSTTDCDANAVPSTHKVLLSYDNLGQLRTENFPDTTPDRTYSYDGNGNLTSLLAGSVSWTYLYNSLNTIEKETLALDGKSFVFDWEYDSLEGLSSLKYPSGAIVDFAPNALGQATKVGSYASGVSYHPNGQIKQFTYGNGIIRNVALDTTGRIDALTDIKEGTVKNSLDPTYDYNDNLARLIDWVDRNNDVDNLTYDGVDRLKSADGKWGSGRYNYDGLGNVLSRSLNNSTITYNYNSLNRLNNLTGAYAYGYQYDTRGNVTNNGRYSLAYNLGQQMTSAKGISYIYDGHNRRVKQTKTDGSHYSVYSQAGQLLYREAANGTKTDSVYLGKQLIAEVDNAESHYIKFERTNPPEVCTQVPIPGSSKTKLSCTQDKKGFSWTTLNASSCTGEVQRLIGTNISGTTKISGTSGSLNLGQHFTLNVTMTCLTNSNQTITATYSL